MLFTRDVELGLQAAADLVNTLPDASRSGGDELSTIGALDAYYREHRFTGGQRHDRAELEAVRALRPRLAALWAAEEEAEVVGLVNVMLADGSALPQLVDHDGVGFHIHATRADQPLADRMMVEFALAWVDVVRQRELVRMKGCAADDCAAVLVDLSRNRSKRFCDVGNCGNRMHVRAFRARAAESA